VKQYEMCCLHYFRGHSKTCVALTLFLVGRCLCKYYIIYYRQIFFVHMWEVYIYIFASKSKFRKNFAYVIFAGRARYII